MARPTVTDPRPSLTSLGRWFLPSVLAGAIAGLLIGGVGGRLAMLTLRLTSGDEVIGIESDDGFFIGHITNATFFLLALTTVAGALMLGPLYALGRHAVPHAVRSLVTASVFGIIGGALFVRRDGVDFTVLEPRWLAVTLFVMLPAVFGLVLEPLQAAIRPRTDRWPGTLIWVLTAFASLVICTIGPPIALVVVLVWAAILTGLDRPALQALRAPGLVWIGRAAILVLVVLAGIDLGRDVRNLL